MRWLKHMTRTRSDEKIALLLSEFGPWGYGIFWMILEIIAEQVDESGRDYATFPEKTWRQNLGISASKFQNFLASCQKSGVFCAFFDDDCEKKSPKLITIKAPNILKYRDEYTNRLAKKSGVHPDSVPPKETDTDKDKEKKRTTNVVPKEKNAGDLFSEQEHGPEKQPVVRGTRLTKGWKPSPEDIAFATALDFSLDEIDVMADSFRDYWIGKTGKDATKLDWPATWRNWVRSQKRKIKNGKNQNEKPNKPTSIQAAVLQRMDRKKL